MQDPPSSRPPFTQASRSDFAERFGTAESRAQARELEERTRRVEGRSRQHYQKHRELWVQREQAKILQREQPQARPRPPVPESRRAAIRQQAERNVDLRQQQRVNRIQGGRDNMLSRLEAREQYRQLREAAERKLAERKKHHGRRR